MTPRRCSKRPNRSRFDLTSSTTTAVNRRSVEPTVAALVPDDAVVVVVVVVVEAGIGAGGAEELAGAPCGAALRTSIATLDGAVMTADCWTKEETGLIRLTDASFSSLGFIALMDGLRSIVFMSAMAGGSWLLSLLAWGADGRAAKLGELLLERVGVVSYDDALEPSLLG